MAEQEKLPKGMTDEEIDALIAHIPDDPEQEEDEEDKPFKSTGNPMYDRWIVDDERINKYGL